MAVCKTALRQLGESAKADFVNAARNFSFWAEAMGLLQFRSSLFALMGL